MSEHTKKHWQNRHRHEAYGGDIFGTFCGREFKGIRTMELNPCMENPTSGDKNSPAR